VIEFLIVVWNRALAEPLFKTDTNVRKNTDTNVRKTDPYLFRSAAQQTSIGYVVPSHAAIGCTRIQKHSRDIAKHGRGIARSAARDADGVQQQRSDPMRSRPEQERTLESQRAHPKTTM